MKPSLEHFQDAFVEALYGADSSEMQALTQQPGFAVYRNTVLKGATDALLANFPTIERLVGTDWLRSAAAIHARISPPTDARLLHYGAEFPHFLDGFEHAREMPYLGDVALLDLLWTHVHCAKDEPVLEMSTLAQLSPTDLANSRLTPRAACRWVWLPDCPAYTIWRVNREQLEMPDELTWQGEGALLTRKVGGVHWQAASAAECAFLDACAADLPLDKAADRASAVEPDLNLENLIIRLVSADAFVAANSGRPF
ncbi:DNA-binding domain-containing protein [Pseudomonas sp. CCI3.2]|uniref:DNA-binding domain-containing protein n=1 Tax=unclassified Pseudomonas TaxID=196821 RepID=UPI002AC9BD60|nr:MULTISPECIES: DNA-binding domain-containing protein [unclassified Pseudomonas]MEB0078290.1 DNA-binding domain-containing protein [Pseudomonas sp. MH10out]MEB0092251.1 DNA-binding domain-containing protein [Pseudomonas sp. CCI4.2]MEB0101744.1 DNA-binding domain-containing protein [Pseudomonas sp. CCI3.2]MEB0132123.1 DNA-binding domain-containing protein [Pseudomonas sp. CCI2.4]MEB0160177.1 DNA-binding domain-containing protein [Pseudomonas sp. AH2 (2023)]